VSIQFKLLIIFFTIAGWVITRRICRDSATFPEEILMYKNPNLSFLQTVKFILFSRSSGKMFLLASILVVGLIGGK
jgi:hypothetical protein